MFLKWFKANFFNNNCSTIMPMYILWVAVKKVQYCQLGVDVPKRFADNCAPVSDVFRYDEMSDKCAGS